MAVIETGSSAAGRANVDSEYNLHTTTPGHTSAGVVRGGGPANAGDTVILCESDPGTVTGARLVMSPEADHDYKLRTMEGLCDYELFNYAAQNTGKHNYANTTMTATWTASGLTTNGGSITTITTGARVRTYALFPLYTTGMLYAEARVALTAAMPTNTAISIGLFTDSGSNPFAPSDGIFFQFDSLGVTGNIVHGGAPAQAVTLSGLTMAINEYRKLVIAVSSKRVEFWADDILYGSIDQAVATIQPTLSAAQPFAVRHAIVGGAASGVIQCKVASYQISVGGSNVVAVAGEAGNRALGSHQGLSGGTMGSLATYANSSTPAGVGGSNTAAAATGLGGQVTINAAAAAATDFILTSYQVPAGSTTVQGRRLVVRGLSIWAANLGAAVATTETTLAYSLAFGHTAVSMATAEAATTKAPRRVPAGILSWAVGAAIGAGPREGSLYVPFSAPIYVNPGEFIAVCAKFLQGTATASQTVYHQIAFDYGWE